MQMTFEERERAAYISGDTALAEVLRAAAFGQECEAELADRLEETDTRVSDLEEERDELAAQVEEHELTISRLREQLADAEGELDAERARQ